MMLFQKPPQFSSTTPYTHRRHYSASPAVVVQPTRTPGLLSLSKPPRPSPQRQQPQQQQQRTPRSTPKSKSALPAANNRSPQPAPAVAHPQSSLQQLKPAAEIVERKATPSPEKNQSQRGRQQAKLSKDKSTRSASNSSVRGRRNNTRQASPPIPSQTSQAEAENPTNASHFTQSQAPTSNLFDPFLDDSPRSNVKSIRAAPTLASQPSGKLARRRQPIPTFSPPSLSVNANQGSPSPAPTKAVPVPRSKRTPNMNISRSDPVLSHMPSHRPSTRRSATTATSSPSVAWDAFPICDDMTDAGDNSDDGDDSDGIVPPATPTRKTWQQPGQGRHYDDGPRTAPLSTSIAGFPFNPRSTPSPTPASRTSTVPRVRKHSRTPSEGIFAMSSDEDSSSTPSSKELKALFGLIPPRRTGSAGANGAASRREREREAQEKAAAAAAGYFASSMFQNSPSPEELPPPSF